MTEVLPSARVLKPGLFVQQIMAVQPMAVAPGIMFDIHYIPEEAEMRVLHGMTIEAKRSDVLEALRGNREAHIEIVEEARLGYAKKAEDQLLRAISEIREGKADPTKGWSFNLQPVIDNIKVYNRAITMFEMEQRDIVKLSQEQVGSLIMDEWDWKEEFIGSNALYSAKARLV